jgi:nucleoside-diphosphate-sugar epimerase
MSILITGSTGFIGAEIVRQLLARGEDEIRALHRSGNFQRLQDVADRVDLIQVDLADVVRSRIPEAEIRFEPNPILQPAIDQAIRPIDDSRARSEWGWEPAYDQEAIVDGFLAELRSHPERYR